MIKGIISLAADFLVGIFKTLLTKNRDEEIGGLKVTNKANQETINDLEKVDAARNDPAELSRVRTEYTRPE